jgi:HEAT repeat protein
MNRNALIACWIGVFVFSVPPVWAEAAAAPPAAEDAAAADEAEAESTAAEEKEEEVDPQVQMVLDLVKGDDAEMRLLGLQFIREQIPGEPATKKFAELVKQVKGDALLGLLEALGERGDVAARAAILETVQGDNAAARAAALKALGPLGTAAEVPVLAQKAGEGNYGERVAARLGLIRLRGDGVNSAIVAEMEKAEPRTRAKLLEVLAARNASEAVAKVLECAEDDDTDVQLAALGALRQLADDSNTADLVRLLKATQDDATRRQAELALLTICSRGREACTGAVLNGLADADAAARIVLLRALARIGEASALERVLEAVQDEDEAVRDEAVRMLAGWRDPIVAGHLIEIASAEDAEDNERHQVLAIRGLVRLAGPQGDQPADLELLGEVLGLAKRPQEKQLVLGVLGGTGDPAALELVTGAINDPAAAQHAAVAAIMIAEKVTPDLSKVRGALKAVIQKSSNPATRAKAQQLLDSL